MKKKTTLRLDEDLLRQLRFLALERGESLQTMLDGVLREFLAREKGRSRRRRARG